MKTFAYITFNGRKLELIARDQHEALNEARKIAGDWGTLIHRRIK